MKDLLIRRAVTSEQKDLEDLQLRASLTNAGDRDALLAHPDAIELPLAQIAAGGVFVAEWNGAIVGFAAVEPRADGESELDALFVDPHMRRRGIARSLVEYCAKLPALENLQPFVYSGILMQRIFTLHVVLAWLGWQRPVSAQGC